MIHIKIKNNKHYESVDKIILEFNKIIKYERNENNQYFLKILCDYLKKNKKKALASQFVYETLVKNKIFFDFSNLPLSIFEVALNEIGNEKYFNFDRKIDSLLAEISVLNTLKNYGFHIKNRENNNGACDWIVEKNNKIFQVEIKQKESDDLFKMRIESFLKGFALLDEYKFLREKLWFIKILVKRNDNNTQKIWDNLIHFIENKEDCFEDENILIGTSDVRKNKNMIKRCPKVHNYLLRLYPDTIIKEKTNEFMLETIRNHLEKLKRKKAKYHNFISSIVLHIDFYSEIEKSFLKYLKEKIENDNLKPFLLLVYHTLEDKKSYFYN